jgi:DNA-binding NtrC family response regulator
MEYLRNGVFEGEVGLGGNFLANIIQKVSERQKGNIFALLN